VTVGLPQWLSTVVKKFPNPLWSYAERWRYAGLDALDTVVSTTATTEGSTFVFTAVSQMRPAGRDTALTAPLATATTVYTVDGDGSVQVAVEIDCRTVGVPTLARVGLRMRLEPELEDLCFFGRGPHENYNDRKSSAHFGLHRSNVREQFVPYIVPGECGGRTDTTWVSAQDRAGRGLVAIAGEPSASTACFALFSAQPFSAEELAAARHTSELGGIDLDGASEVRPQGIHLSLDHRHMGIGGDVGWLPCVHRQFLVEPDIFRYSLRLVPLRGGSKPEEVAAQRQRA